MHLAAFQYHVGGLLARLFYGESFSEASCNELYTPCLARLQQLAAGQVLGSNGLEHERADFIFQLPWLPNWEEGCSLFSH
jgi:hypothetical protein